MFFDIPVFAYANFYQEVNCDKCKSVRIYCLI